MAREKLTTLRKAVISKTFKLLTHEKVDTITFIRDLNEDEILWECKGETTSLAIVTCKDFITTYADTLDMFDDEDEFTGVGDQKRLSNGRITQLIFT